MIYKFKLSLDYYRPAIVLQNAVQIFQNALSEKLNSTCKVKFHTED